MLGEQIKSAIPERRSPADPVKKLYKLLSLILNPICESFLELGTGLEI
jgi:hypothetical protein